MVARMRPFRMITKPLSCPEIFCRSEFIRETALQTMYLCRLNHFSRMNSLPQFEVRNWQKLRWNANKTFSNLRKAFSSPRIPCGSEFIRERPVQRQQILSLSASLANEFAPPQWYSVWPKIRPHRSSLSFGTQRGTPACPSATSMGWRRQHAATRWHRSCLSCRRHFIKGVKRLATARSSSHSTGAGLAR